MVNHSRIIKCLLLSILFPGFNVNANEAVYLPAPMSGSDHRFCKHDGMHGVCTFSWNCHHFGGHRLGICRVGSLFGACCSSPTIISPTSQMKFLPGGHAVPRSNEECGISLKNTTSSRIVNGEDALVAELPWQVSLRIVTPLPITINWCGAVLLNHEWVVTAAHCIRKFAKENIVLRFGAHYVFSTSGSRPSIERGVRTIIVHPKFLQIATGFDIALLRMEEPIEFSDHISPICLPGSISTLEHRIALVSGWGQGLLDGEYPTKLQKVNVPILSNTECDRMYRLEGKILDLNENFLCAGYEEGGRDSCQGDSGGPLQVQEKDGRWVLVGITSSGFKCAKPNLPGLYSRVSTHVPWILRTIDKENRFQ